MRQSAWNTQPSAVYIWQFSTTENNANFTAQTNDGTSHNGYEDHLALQGNEAQ